MNLPKSSLKRTLVLLAIAGFVLSPALIFYFIFKSSNQSSLTPIATPTTIDKQEKVNYGLPVRLKIPKINVDAAVEYVGITPQGEMGVPKGPTNVAWFNQGSRPGEKGNSVIDGHFGWKDGIPAVFDNLHTLQKGDNLYVEDEKGVTTAFVVRELRTYGQNDDSSDVFRSSDEKAHLNLITCQGAWNKDKKSYSNRLVVFADKQTGL